MPNRDHDDSYFDRSSGRFVSREGRPYGTPSQPGNQRPPDWEPRYTARSEGRDARSVHDTQPGYAEPRYPQRYEPPTWRTQAYGQSDYEREPSAYTPEWRSYAQDWRDSSPARQSGARTWPRAEGYAQQRTDHGHRHESVFGEAESIRQEWDRSLARNYTGPHSEPQRGAPYGQHDEETIGQQIRHAGHQVVNRVKRAFRGPKGYKRSDERILEDVNERFARQDQVDPSEIEVRVEGAEVTLTGTVHSRWEKFAAEEIADDVSGVEEVHNQLRVRRADGTISSSERNTSSPTTQAEGPLGNRNIRA